jgi:hypothetical protein
VRNSVDTTVWKSALEYRVFFVLITKNVTFFFLQINYLAPVPCATLERVYYLDYNHKDLAGELSRNSYILLLSRSVYIFSLES